MTSNIAERLSEVMKYKGFKISSFADFLNVSHSFVSQILSGKRNPGHELIVTIATKLPEINLRWLLTGEGEMFFAFSTNEKARLLRGIYPDLDDDPNIDELVEHLQVPVIRYALISKFLIEKVDNKKHIEEFFKEKKAKDNPTPHKGGNKEKANR